MNLPRPGSRRLAMKSRKKGGLVKLEEKPITQKEYQPTKHNERRATWTQGQKFVLIVFSPVT